MTEETLQVKIPNDRDYFFSEISNYVDGHPVLLEGWSRIL